MKRMSTFISECHIDNLINMRIAVDADWHNGAEVVMLWQEDSPATSSAVIPNVGTLLNKKEVIYGR
jgi:hypothetical protein